MTWAGEKWSQLRSGAEDFLSGESGSVEGVGNAVTGSALSEAWQAAFDAADNIDEFTVPSKHLAEAGGWWAKFSTVSQTQAREWIQEALSSPNAEFYANNRPNSFKVITDLGIQIGTGGHMYSSNYWNGW